MYIPKSKKSFFFFLCPFKIKKKNLPKKDMLKHNHCEITKLMHYFSIFSTLSKHH